MAEAPKHWELVQLGDMSVEGDKRQYFTSVVRWICPNCGERHEDDYSDRYLMYPETNKPRPVNLYCETCGKEFKVELVPVIRLELPPGVVAPGMPEEGDKTQKPIGRETNGLSSHCGETVNAR